MPAASASSRVVVPAKPLRANSGIAASTILCRRSSLSSRVAAMMRKSKRSLTFGQYTGLRQKRMAKKTGQKKMGGHVPQRPPNQLCGNGRLPPYPAGMRATRRREGPAYSRPAAQPQNSPTDREIHDNREVRPVVAHNDRPAWYRLGHFPR